MGASQGHSATFTHSLSKHSLRHQPNNLLKSRIYPEARHISSDQSIKKKKKNYHQCLTITRLSRERIQGILQILPEDGLPLMQIKISLEVWGSEERQKAATVTDHKVCLAKLMRLTTHCSAGDSGPLSSLMNMLVPSITAWSHIITACL